MYERGERERETLGTRNHRSRQAHSLDASAPYLHFAAHTWHSKESHGTLPGYHFPEDEKPMQRLLRETGIELEL